ncbi:uncharacterized protein EAF01_000016 [Botrytis porri]|uniref:Uncharacterized protein n=1 Tax=Botrytis porri TaxID=87229 RepID=A0A4Z1KSM6_9HELO|nr:uncharacterized protein EAF01_000016 [Botrytis porri]KAF7913610.1 hypothetical protein EAF01_000016 [Botrytis porri]TGO86025.1 hypothetical protein BPOR_0342g00090 [Botrytis porri]
MSAPTSRYPAAEGPAGAVTTWIPLTTVYPLIPKCTTELYSPNNLTVIYAYDPNNNAEKFATRCWPSEARSWWNQVTSASTTISLGPFLCPEAYTVAVTTVVNSGSTLSGCCPSGYALSAIMSQPFPGQCTSTITSGATITYVSIWTPAADGYTTLTGVLDRDHPVQAVQINGYNFDGNSAVPTVTAFSSGASTSSTSGSASKSETAASGSTPSSSGAVATSISAFSSLTTSDSSSSSGLSTGAKIGIAVGIAVGVAAIAALIGTIFFMKRRRKYDTAPQQDNSYATSQMKMDQVASLSPSPGSNIPHEMGHGYGYEAHEVGNTQVHELNGSAFAEPDGNNRS